MKYLMTLISVFLMFSCNDEINNAETNPLLINQCENRYDCIDENENYNAECNLVLDRDHNTKRFECTPFKCFGWENNYGYYRDNNNCIKYKIDKKGK